MTHHRIIIGDSRAMTELADQSVHLVVTSPPYWQIKDYGAKNRIGFRDATIAHASPAAFRESLVRPWLKFRLESELGEGDGFGCVSRQRSELAAEYGKQLHR